jgi:hypothetical protein
MAAVRAPTNLRPSTIEQILGTAGQAISSAGTTAKNAIAGATTTITTGETGSYILKVLYYLMMYSFFIFIILLLVHFTYKPIFRFIPGTKGIINIPGASDDKVYWNDRKQPANRSYVPVIGDELASYPFVNNFSFSVDLYIRKLPDTDVKNRVILIKSTPPPNNNFKEFDTPPAVSFESLESYMNQSSGRYGTMIMYLTQTNDLVVTFFNNNLSGQSIAYASRPIYNIPLYTPFRVTVVVESKMFTVYMNGKQVFQRVLPNDIAGASPQRFYSPPGWATLPTKTIFLQNFHLWPRAISSTEVSQAVPALATAPDFDMPAEAGGGSCY